MLRTLSAFARAMALIGAVVATFAISMVTPARAEQTVDMDHFYTELAPHGRWFEHDRFGYVWSPRVSEPDWRPYTRGRWAWTEEHGWYWVSSEEWGWATYHYGRWTLDDEYGWVWIPGTEWGPAWVAWRESDDYIGWAPLPPDAAFGPTGVSFAAGYYDSPRWTPLWCFVAPRYMTYSSGIHVHVLPYHRNVTFFARTRFVNNYVWVNNRIVNRGIDFRFVERRGGIRIAPLRLVVVDNHRRLGAGVGVLNVYRPQVRVSVNLRPQHVVRREEIRAEKRLPGLAFTPRGGGGGERGAPVSGGAGVSATGVAVGAAAGAAAGAVILKGRANAEKHGARVAPEGKGNTVSTKAVTTPVGKSPEIVKREPPKAATGARIVRPVDGAVTTRQPADKPAPFIVKKGGPDGNAAAGGNNAATGGNVAPKGTVRAINPGAGNANANTGRANQGNPAAFKGAGNANGAANRVVAPRNSPPPQGASAPARKAPNAKDERPAAQGR